MDFYLDVLLCQEGHGCYVDLGCSVCKHSEAVFHCHNCSGFWLLCRQCIKKSYQAEPLHIIEVCYYFALNPFCSKCSVQVWKSTHFERTSLGTLGIWYQLGHPPNMVCALAKPAYKDFLIIHHNGLHNVLVNFCGCSSHFQPYQQLLTQGWFPSTLMEPRTCAMFALLHQFHILNLQAKTMMYDFYKVLSQLTDGTGLSNLLVSLMSISLHLNAHLFPLPSL